MLTIYADTNAAPRISVTRKIQFVLLKLCLDFFGADILSNTLFIGSTQKYEESSVDIDTNIET